MNAIDSMYAALEAASPHVDRGYDKKHDRLNDALEAGQLMADYECVRNPDKYADDFAAVMTGATCDFWASPPKWDAEQYLVMFAAVRVACAIHGTAAERWSVVERALAKCAHEYAGRK